MTSASNSEQRATGALAVLRLVHKRPGTPRAEAARILGLSSSSATEITAQLRSRELVDELAPGPLRGRGRPSGLLVAHPSGPLVCAVEIAHSSWRVAAVELGGHVVGTSGGRRPHSPEETMAEIRRALTRLHKALGSRVRAVAVSVAGTVSAGRIQQAATLRWQEVDLGGVVPPALRRLPFVAGNDATLAGLAEARRGAAAEAGVVLYLDVEVGIGGVLVIEGQPFVGARGEGGEFGHMPFGSEELECPCGASGCWDLEVDGRALARALGRRAPADPRTFAARAIAAATAGAPAESAAVAVVAAALGRGSGALVNALDPDLVVYGGLAPELWGASRATHDAAYHAALMRHRRNAPPAIVASALGPDASLLGAAESGFDQVLTPALLADAGVPERRYA